MKMSDDQRKRLQHHHRLETIDLFNIPLPKLIEHLQAAIDRYPNYEMYIEYCQYTEVYSLFGICDETDEEYEKRIARLELAIKKHNDGLKKRAAEKKRRDIETYLKLREKFKDVAEHDLIGQINKN